MKKNQWKDLTEETLRYYFREDESFNVLLFQHGKRH